MARIVGEDVQHNEAVRPPINYEVLFILALAGFTAEDTFFRLLGGYGSYIFHSPRSPKPLQADSPPHNRILEPSSPIG